jgi:hypothetical protein
VVAAALPIAAAASVLRSWWRDDLDFLLALGRRLELQPEIRSRVMAALLRVRNKDGMLVPLAANRVQQEYERTATGRNLVLKARQMGVTTWIAGRIFLSVITRPGTIAVQVAHDQTSAEEIFRIVHRFMANLPPRLRVGALRTSRANVRQIVLPALDSEYRVETAADPNAGRGLTIRHLHGSEVARWPGPAAETLASLRAAVPPAGEIVLESTPAGAGSVFYDEWQRAEETGYARHFFPWWWESGYTKKVADPGPLTPEEQELIARFGLKPGQIAYRRELRSNFRVLAPQEFAEDPHSCFLASRECVFDLEVVERRLAECPEPAESRDSGRLQVFWPPVAGRQYILGVDPAGGGAEGDYACAQVIEREKALQCAELRGHFPPAELAARVAALAREYNQALVAVERNNHGHAVLAYLQMAEHYHHLYQKGSHLGWLTSALTRPPMIENLGAVLAVAPELFSGRRLLEECRTFVRRPEGSAGALSGANDDCVLAMAIALAVRSELPGLDSHSGNLELAALPER